MPKSKTYINPIVVRQVFILLIILSIAVLILNYLLPYLSGLLGAITLYVVLRKPMKALISKGWPKSITAILLMVFSVFCIMLPIVGLGFMLTNKIEYAVQNSQKVIDAAKTQLQNIEAFVPVDLSDSIDTSAMSSWLSDKLQNFAGGTFTMAIAIFLMYFLLYFMLTHMHHFKKALFVYVPIKEANLKLITTDTEDKVKANALGIPLVAIGQGLVALVGFLLFDIPDPFFWAAIVTIGSMIPFVGSALGIVPVFLLTLSNGESFTAWGILIYGFTVIGATDNLLRLFILKRLDNIHPLITLIGVLVGIPLFGFIGLIFGPILISLFLIVLKIYKDEYGHEQERL